MILEFLAIFFVGYIALDIFYKKKNFLFIGFIILFLLAVCFRNPMEHDTKEYISFFYRMPLGCFYVSDSRFEIGFQILTGVLNFFCFNSYPIYFFLIALIDTLLIYKASKNILPFFFNCKVQNSQHYLLLLLFLCYFGIYYFAIVIRASLAICLGVYAVSILIRTSSLRKSILFLILSLFFHASAFFNFFIYFIILFFKAPSKILLIIFWLFTGFIYISNFTSQILILILKSPIFGKFISVSPSIENLFWVYINMIDNHDYGISKRFILNYILEFIFILSNKKNEIHYRKLLSIYCIGIFLMTAGRAVAQIERVTDYFIIYQPFLLVPVFSKTRKLFRSKFIYYLMLGLFISIEIFFSVNIFNMSLSQNIK